MRTPPPIPGNLTGAHSAVLGDTGGRIEALVEEAGYACPVICTPEELMEEIGDE